MHNSLKKLLPAFAAMLLMASLASAKIVKLDNMIWADGEIYSSIVTPNFFKVAPNHSLDILFVISGVPNQRMVSDAGPGNPHYNGGRWAVHGVTVNPDGLAYLTNNGMTEITSADVIWSLEAMGYAVIEDMETYFACPLIK